MKTNVTLWLTAMLAVSACGSSAQFASSGQQYQDGIYYRPTTENKSVAAVSNEEVQALVNQTKQSEIYLFNDSGRDTIVVPDNKPVQLKFNRGGNTTVTILDKNPSIDIYMGYGPYLSWGYSSWSWDPWYYDSWYRDPWYYSGWYSPWRYNRWYRDPWYYDSWYWRDPWYSGWYSPWSGYYAGYYDPWYNGYYGGWYGHYYGYYDAWWESHSRGISGTRQDLGYGRSWGSRDAVSRSAGSDMMGSYSSTVRRSDGNSRIGSKSSYSQGERQTYRASNSSMVRRSGTSGNVRSYSNGASNNSGSNVVRRSAGSDRNSNSIYRRSQVTQQDQTIIGEAVLQEAATGTVRLMKAALQATIGTILLHIMAMVLQQITAEALRLHLMTAVLQAATAEAVHLHLMVAVLPEAIAEVHQVQVPAQKAVIQDHPVEVREEDTGDKIIRIFTVNFKTRKTI